MNTLARHTWYRLALCMMVAGALAMGCAAQQAMTPGGTDTTKNAVRDIEVVTTEQGKQVVVEGEGPLTYTFFRLVPHPLQVMVDLPETTLPSGMSTPIAVDDDIIKEVGASQTAERTEVYIALHKLVKYHVEKDGNRLVVNFVREPSSAVAEPAGIEEKEVEAPAPATQEKAEPAPKVVEEPLPKIAEELPEAQNLVDVFVDTSPADAVVISMKGDGKIENYSSFSLKNPPRVVVDLKNVKRQFGRKSVAIESPYVKQVRLGDYPDKVRVVVDAATQEVPPYYVDSTGSQVNVVAGKGALAKLAAAKEKETVEEKRVPAAQPGKVTGVHFKQLEGVSRLIVSTSTKASHRVTKGPEDTVIVELPGMMIPKGYIRHLDTTEFASPVATVTPMNLTVEGQRTARLVVKLEKMVNFDVKEDDTSLYIDFERTEEFKEEKPKPIEVVTVKKEGEPAEAAKAAEPAEATKEEPPVAAAVVTREVAAPVSAVSTQPMLDAAIGQKKYTGKKITLDFKDADIGNILRLFAEVSDLNIIATEDVKGSVTIRLVDVPWDQAMDIVLEASGLGMERIGNVIRIAPMDRLRREKEAKASAIKAGEQLEPLSIELIGVSYSKASDLAAKVKDVLSSRGTVTVDERTNTLIVKDIRSGIDEARTLVKKLDAQTPQILIHAKIVEANTNFARELGISWGGTFTDIVNKGNTTVGVDGATGTTSGRGLPWVVDLPATTGLGSGGAIDFLISNIAGTKALEVKISALEENGEGRVLSSPRITTLDHTEAYIEQGLRIPYPKLTEEGTVTTEFIEANLKLTVTPHVTADGHIKMEVTASRDRPDFTQAVLGVPAIDKKEAKTEVLVKDGEVLVIGGIYEYDKLETTDGVPYLSKIPLLGWAFKTKKKQDDRRELLIFIAPRIVQPRTTTAAS